MAEHGRIQNDEIKKKKQSTDKRTTGGTQYRCRTAAQLYDSLPVPDMWVWVHVPIFHTMMNMVCLISQPIHKELLKFVPPLLAFCSDIGKMLAAAGPGRQNHRP